MTSAKPDIDLIGYVIHDLSHALRLAVIYTERSARSNASSADRDLLAAYAACRDAEARLGNAHVMWQANQKAPFVRSEHLALDDALVILADVVDSVSTMRSGNRREVLQDMQDLRNHPGWLPLSPAFFRQAIWNLVQNAFKYSYPHEPIQISGSVRDRDRIEFTIRSRGITIGEDEIDKVMECGVRGREVAGLEPGMGFGLYVTRTIMSMCGGRLTLSVRDDVTVACVELPVSRRTKDAGRGRRG